VTQRAAALHAGEWQGVFYVTGGGASLLAELLNTPGASGTVLEASVPYAEAALTELLGQKPAQACSETTARQLAMRAYSRAKQLGEGTLFGFGVTASLATGRPKRGTHRAHWAIQTATCSRSFAATFNAERAAEEQLLLTYLWSSLRHCLMDPKYAMHPAVQAHQHQASPAWHPLLEEAPFRYCTDTHDGRLILPGSFNPQHEGHRAMLAVAEQTTGLRGAYELAVRNADKPDLDFLSIAERLRHIEDRPVWLTNTPTFEDKARLFPGATFALGVDTLARIGELRFYAGQAERLQTALRTFVAQDVRFLVFGRLMGDRFVGLDDLDLPTRLKRRCRGIDEAVYRNDISSTQIRQGR